MNISDFKDARIKELQRQIDGLVCFHPCKPIRYRLASNSTKMYKFQCIRCGELFGKWIPHADIENPDDITIIDDGLKERYAETIRELEIALKEVQREVEKEDFDNTYEEYLKSPEWLKKRDLVLERCDHRCEGCGINIAFLVHHLTYNNVYKEFLFELVGLCGYCHEEIHTKDE